MTTRDGGARILIYSHDSFGLGHLRRCRTIAQSLVGAFDDLSVLILSGSPLIGSFEFRSRVDFVRVPGVIKHKDGGYTSLHLPFDIERTVALRESIIRQTALAFDPDIFIVDKEPLGLRGEVEETLKALKARGTKCVLGLRDILDEPAHLAPEWTRKQVAPALEALYDEIWVYGLPQVYEPLEGLDLAPSIARKTVYTGYLRTELPKPPVGPAAVSLPAWEHPYILATAGGGDGEALFDWVLKAYEADPAIPHPALLVLGPFMAPQTQEGFMARVARLSNVFAITFDAHIEHLMNRAAAVVAMGGYNTFCDILSFDKPALLLPRTQPRLEQAIRATRAQELGFVSMLYDEIPHDPLRMATALRHLPQQAHPSSVVVPGVLDGLDNIGRLVSRALTERRRPMVVSV